MISLVGTADPVVAFSFGELTNQALHKLCSKHEFKAYSGLSHSSSPQVRKNKLKRVIAIISVSVKWV